MAIYLVCLLKGEETQMTFIRLLTLFIALSFSNIYAADLTALLQQGQNHIATGHYHDAIHQLKQAKKIAIANSDGYNTALITALNAYIDLQQQQSEAAEKSLLSTLEITKKQKWVDLTAKIQLYLGQLNYRQSNSDEAVRYFKKIIEQSETITEKSLLISAYSHLAKVTQEYDSSDKIIDLLKESELVLTALPTNKITAKAWLNLGYRAFSLYQKKNGNKILQMAYRYLNTALAQSKAFKQLRVQASSLQYLAQLYQQQQRNDEAIKLTEKGIYIAQQQSANDILINLEFLLGKLLQTENKLTEATGAYRRAVDHIEAIRLDIPVSYENGRSSFRETLAPIYLGLADLLLQQSAKVDASSEQILLKEAQDVIELMKKSELEDFFQSRCEIAAKPIDLKKTDTHAAAIYPIPFKDRLDIIVYTSQGLKRFTSNVSAEKLEKTARIYADNLHTEEDFDTFKSHAILLYQWLIEPLDLYLKSQQIETLVYLPDGALRLFPLDSVYSGEKFLLEDYAVVTSPGMSLIETKPTNYNQQQNILFAGVSIPGDVIYNLPDSLLNGLLNGMTIENETARKTRDRWLKQNQTRSLIASEKVEKTRALRELLRNPQISGKLKDELALPAVSTEIKGLSEKNNMPYLLNESFNLENFSKILTAKPYKILHIASHGFFGTTEDENFIMAHDKVLNINKLQELLTLDHFKKHPIDLIILSACQTAEGDDRSPLGISGMAIKAKVHSALGSLWPVSDEATAQLMRDFYENLKDPQLSKAQALQQAKLNLLKQKRFSNPAKWSPFILVGNWK